MRIKKITVKKFKNLIDFNCEFFDSNISAFIGNNGAGKSHILELITRAFSNAMNYYCGRLLPAIYIEDEPSVIDCIIEYELNGKIYQLIYNDDIFDIMEDARSKDKKAVYEYVKIQCDGKRLTKSSYLEALPSSILLYYAGETKRQKGHAEDTYDSGYDSKLKRMESDDLPGLKYMDFYGIDDLPILLLVLSAYKGERYNKILELFGCKGIIPKFNITLGKPDKGKGSIDTYWNSTGFVKYFLDTLRKYILGTREIGDKYFMFFNSAELLTNCANNEFELFTKLKALKNYGILKHIGIELEKNDGSKFSQLRLSEGEKQLAMIFLLTSYTANNDCLYLFDEFDAYLHLNWQRYISKMLNDIDVNGHIIFTTHSPGTISKIKSDNLYIMRYGKIVYPESETYNRALDEIMLEQMDVSMRPPEVEELYDNFKQSVAERNKEQAEYWMHVLEDILDETDPLFTKMRINLRRI